MSNSIQSYILNVQHLAGGGFCPAWWKNDYPSYGNSNMAGDMQNCDLTDPNGITQGPGLATLVNGTQADAVTTLIKGILNKAISSDNAYATGGAKLYRITNTTVTDNVTWPHTIDKAAVTGESGEDVCYFQGNLYYSYNYTGGGDIGKYDLSSTFDDDYGSTAIGTGATTLQASVPHQMVATEEFMYIANKNYVTQYDGDNDILTEAGLDLPENDVIQSICLAGNRLYVATNNANLSGSNRNVGTIYKWDRNSTSWDADSIYGIGKVGGIYSLNNVVYVFYQDITSTGGYKLGYISGNNLVELCHFEGALPSFYQITEVEGHLVWASSGLIWAFGSSEERLNKKIFQYCDGGYSTVGGIACPFGKLVIASNQSTNYKLTKSSGYDTSCNWKSIVYDIGTNGPTGRAFIEKIVINFDTLASGARVDLTMTNDLGNSTYTGTISHSGDGAVTQKIFYPSRVVKNTRIEFDWSNGSTSNPVKIHNFYLEGHTL